MLGIIGTNGAGKSTLLKLLARVSVPTKGGINVRGSVAPLIKVGAGLHPELTGRENIYLNGSIMGLPRAVRSRKSSTKSRFSALRKEVPIQSSCNTPSRGIQRMELLHQVNWPRK